MSGGDKPESEKEKRTLDSSTDDSSADMSSSDDDESIVDVAYKGRGIFLFISNVPIINVNQT